jgi:hypothetical protein
MKHQWTIREEANALTCCAFRNGFLEDLHAGKHSELLEKPGLSRITDVEMKKLMMQSSAKLAELLALKETDPDKYWKQVEFLTSTIAGSGKNKFQMRNVSVSDYIRFLARHSKSFPQS